MIKKTINKLRLAVALCALSLLYAEQALAFASSAPTTGFGYYFYDKVKNGVFDGPLGWTAGLGLLGATVFFGLKGPKWLAPVALVGAGAIPNATSILTSTGLLF